MSIGSPRTAGPQPGDVRRLARPSRLAPVDHDDVLANAAVVVREPDGGVGHLAGAGLTPELSEYLGGLGDSGGAERMAAADQPTARVHHHGAAVVALPVGHERPRLALPAEAELLVRDQLGDREAVVDLGDVHVARRDAGHPVRRSGGALERRPGRVILVERGPLEAVELLPRAAEPHRPVPEARAS